MEVPEILLEKLSSAKKVAALTGAGVSAESGIKTFRDPDGLWSKFNAMELASMDGFMSNPGLVWSWYRQRNKIMRDTKPNQGHYAIAEMQELFPGFTLITQNIDRLHHQSGSKDVVELHGNIEDNHCVQCKKYFEGETELPGEEVPVCPHCGGNIRPSVVWFGEMLPEYEINYAHEVAVACDVFFSIGTSAEVFPAAHLPVYAKQAGAFTVEVNPNSTSISNYMDVCLRAVSGEAMPLLLEKYKQYISEKDK